MSQTVFRYRIFPAQNFSEIKKMIEQLLITLGLILSNIAIGLLIIQGD